MSSVMADRPPATGGYGRGRRVKLEAQTTPGGLGATTDSSGFGASNINQNGETGFGFGSFGGASSYPQNQPSNRCRNCGQTGHFARDCTFNSFGSATRGGRARACYQCQKTDHVARDCSEAVQISRSGGFGGGGFNEPNTGFGGGGFNSGQSDGGFGFASSNDGGFGGGQNNGGFSGSGFASSGGGGFGSSDGFGGGNQESRSSWGRGGGRSRGRGSLKCGDLNHISRNCTNPQSGGDFDHPRSGFGGSGFEDGGNNQGSFGGGFCSSNAFGGDANSGGGRFDSGGAFGSGNRRGASGGGADQRGNGVQRAPSKYVPQETALDELWKQHIMAGVNFDRYYDIQVDVTGADEDRKQPITSFDGTGLASQLLINVQKAGYKTPTPIQQYAIPYILAGRDIMACAQTGSGKTAAFLLPILTVMINSDSMMQTLPGSCQEPIVVVIVPTRELAIQIKDEARKFSAGTNAKVVTIYGGTDVFHQRNTLRQGCNILVATPGRLSDFLDRGHIGLKKCRYLVLDEADRMLDMGFEASVRKLAEAPDMPPKTDRQTLMFSATFPSQIQNLAMEFLNDQVFITVGKVGAANMDIHQEVVLVTPGEKKDRMLEYVQATMVESKDEDGVFHKKCLIFVERKRMADYVALQLVEGDTPIDAISLHGDRLQKEREEVLHRFKSGLSPVLVATDVAARGLDIPDVDHVINYDMPRDISDYVHRIGRTARVGNIGRATSFFDSSTDTAIAIELIKVLVDAKQDVPEWLQQLVYQGSYSFADNGSGFNAVDSGWPN